MAMTDPKRQFIEAAKQHGFNTEVGNPAATNRAYDKTIAAVKQLRALPDKGRRFLSACLADDDPFVVMAAAFFLLPLSEAEAIGALKRVARTDTGLLGLDAEVALEEWRAGRLTVD
jgi:hypothetical protein